MSIVLMIHLRTLSIPAYATNALLFEHFNTFKTHLYPHEVTDTFSHYVHVTGETTCKASPNRTPLRSFSPFTELVLCIYCSCHLNQGRPFRFRIWYGPFRYLN